MKRLIVFILLVALLCCINMSFVSNLTLDNLFSGCCVEIYTSSKTDNDLKKIDNGSGEIIYCDVDALKYFKESEKISGITLKIHNTNIEEILKKLNVKDTYNKNFGLYGWSQIIKTISNFQFNNINLDGNWVNFQCVQKANYVLLGIPILLGSY